MLLTGTQVSLVFSSLIIVFSALVLFAAGAYLQHDSVKNIRAIVKPRLHVHTVPQQWSLARDIQSQSLDFATEIDDVQHDPEVVEVERSNEEEEQELQRIQRIKRTDSEGDDDDEDDYDDDGGDRLWVEEWL